ncbi:MAG: sugar transferase [Frankiales bacterium]|nr:MAG: sugar transferase [Frankiales bacterium]
MSLLDDLRLTPSDSRPPIPLQPIGPPAPSPLFVAPQVRWLSRYARALVAADGAALVLASAVAVLAELLSDSSTLRPLPLLVLATGVPLLWWAVLAFSRVYEPRFLGEGTEEFRRVGNASLKVGATVAFLAYAFQLPVPRSFVAVLLPLGTVLLLLGRFAGRRVLVAGRRKGRFSRHVLVVGSGQQVTDLARHLHSRPVAGLKVVGICQPDVRTTHIDLGGGVRVPVVGSLQTIPGAASMTGADVVAVAPAPAMGADALRRLSYDLEGTGVDLMVAPALTDVTGTRVSIRPVAGLPLLHVDEPELTGARKLVKSAFDRVLAALALLLLAPALLGLAVAVRLTSPGPAFFRQERVGRDGQVFRLWKLRSMTVDAEERRADLLHLNEHDGAMFKIRDDPRVTPLGRVLRAWSLDELPQLVNVLRGDMSLVGPRPPLPDEVATYDGHTHRRLLVKPGITGLWQVSGRSDLSWDETVRLDLQYVEGWSLGLDLTLLARTVVTVLRGRGAY